MPCRKSVLAALLLGPANAWGQQEGEGLDREALPGAEDERADDALFGSDISAGAGLGILLGSWPLAGPHSTFHARFEAFTVSAATPGPRLGVSLFGDKALGLLQDASEEQEGVVVEFPFSYLHYGVLSVLRFDPALPWTGTAGFGFGRLDLENYYGGPHALPTLIFEGGVRRHLGRATSPAFFDLGLRASWGSARGLSYELDEWWLVQLSTSLGWHVR